MTIPSFGPPRALGLVGSGWSLAQEVGSTVLRLCAPTLLEVFGGIERAVLAFETRERLPFRRADRQMGGCKRGLDAERAAGGDSFCRLDAGSQRLRGSGENLLHDPHAKSIVRTPVLCREHVAHGVCPTCLAHKPHSRTTTGKPAPGILVL